MSSVSESLSMMSCVPMLEDSPLRSQLHLAVTTSKLSRIDPHSQRSPRQKRPRTFDLYLAQSSRQRTRQLHSTRKSSRQVGRLMKDLYLMAGYGAPSAPQKMFQPRTKFGSAPAAKPENPLKPRPFGSGCLCFHPSLSHSS